MSERYRQVAAEYLARAGYPPRKIEEILTGFDLYLPVYEQRLEPRAIVYQFVRRPSPASVGIHLGNWFCLPGASLEALAIFSGGAGRVAAKVQIEHSFVALEGTAARQARQWSWSGGGAGGATQIFVPDRFLMTHVSVLGYDTELTRVAGA